MAKPARDPERRPDPDALLTLAGRPGRGRLKVFVGAAPGVGKTYAMLQAARRVKAEGVDVVIGLVETHGRAETAALLEGLEVLPRRRIDHRGRVLEEFDLDAALARRPKLVVVDELPHSNPEPCRHPKRWQDVQELLDAGIDVWTALNVQHLESLADVVARITGVIVRETVPDKVLKEADDVVLVDITPDELIARLHEGKIYVPDMARRAVDNFFTAGNLTALRELALRRTADRVDDQVSDYLRQQAIGGPWGASERLLVCIGDEDDSDMLVRKASRLATGLNGSFVAVHLARAGVEPMDATRSRKAESALMLAERLGGESTRLVATDFPAEILRLAERENATQIVLGRSRRRGPLELLRPSLARELIRRAGDIDVHVVPCDTPARSRRVPTAWRERAGLVADVSWAGGTVAAAIVFGHALGLLVRLPNMSMIFLAAVLVCALRAGTRSAVIASIFSFLAYNFFFIPPLYTFTIAEPHEVFALFVFLLVAVLTGSLAGRVRRQAEVMVKRASDVQSLYEFSRRISGEAKAEEVLWIAALHIHKTFNARALMLRRRADGLDVIAAWPPETELDAANRTAAEWALQKAEPAGWKTQTLPNLSVQYRPLRSPRAVVGVCGFAPADPARPLAPDEDGMLTAILEQTAIALDRALLFDEAVQAAALKENEAVRDALLASLSHDLRTPLATITGAASSLRELGDRMTPDQRTELVDAIEHESARLARFVANLLDMSRLESGATKVRRDFVDVADVVRAAAERARKAFPNARTEVSIAPDLPYIRGDATLLEQVLFNLLDNAHKYAGDTGAVIHTRREDDNVLISVTDEGPGIKAADLGRIFEKFYRGGRADGRLAGTGLGLSICRGLIAAMGGTIEAQSPAIRRRGTRIVIRLPVAAVDRAGAAA